MDVEMMFKTIILRLQIWIQLCYRLWETRALCLRWMCSSVASWRKVMFGKKRSLLLIALSIPVQFLWTRIRCSTSMTFFSPQSHFHILSLIIFIPLPRCKSVGQKANVLEKIAALVNYGWHLYGWLKCLGTRRDFHWSWLSPSYKKMQVIKWLW